MQKKGLKGKSDEEINLIADQLIKLFCCLHSRDTFIGSYQKFFANRLLDKTFENKEAEILFLQKLKIQCGHNIVFKLESMFKDINISKDDNDEFKKSIFSQSIEESGITFNVDTLTNGHWPNQ